MEKITTILNAARDLFAQKGFDHTPVSDIAKKAGVAGGTIIYHFKNKENLLFILIRQILYALYRQAQDEMASAGNGIEGVQAYIRAYFKFITVRETEYLVYLKTTPFEILKVENHPNADVKIILNRYVELLEEAINLGLKDGTITSGPARDKTRLIFAMLTGAGQMAVQFGDDAPTLQREAMHFALAGLTS